VVAVRLVLAALGAALLLAPPAQGAEAMPGCAAPESKGGDWKTYGHDYSNTRTQPLEKVISVGDMPSLTSAWVFSSVSAGGAGDFTGTPVVSDGCVYVASTRGWVFAVNADTGELVWKYQLPYGGSVNSTVAVADRRLRPPAKRKTRRCRKGYVRGKGGRCVRRKGARRVARRCRKGYVRGKGGRCVRRKRAARPAPKTAGTVYVAVTRLSKQEGCPPGDPCVGPYMVALDQKTGTPVWITGPIDDQPGADVYASPVIFDGILMMGVSGGAAELGGDEADRYAFQGSMTFTDADTGRLIKKTYTIHPPKQPEDDFAGAGVWSTPAIDPEEKVAYVGTANPYKPQAEHKYANSVVKYDLDRRSKTFGEIVGHYKGIVDEYVPALSTLPCYDFPGNNPPFYPQGLGSCGDIDLDFGASPNLFRDATGRKLVGAGQKSGVYHVFDAKTMEPVWTQIVGPPTPFGGIVGSTAYDGTAVYGPVTVPGYLWSLDAEQGGYRWIGPIADGLHWGNPVSVANGVAYTVDFSGFLDAFDVRTGALLTRRPLQLGGGSTPAISWGGVSIARNTIFAAVGVVGLADGFVVAFRPGTLGDLQQDLAETGGGGGGGGGEGLPAGATVVAGPAAASTGYATPLMVMQKGGALTFANFDVVQHDVVADNGSFKSKLIGLAETAPVEGAEKLDIGSYGFFCSVHPGMRGTLQVQ